MCLKLSVGDESLKSAAMVAEYLIRTHRLQQRDNKVFKFIPGRHLVVGGQVSREGLTMWIMRAYTLLLLLGC